MITKKEIRSLKKYLKRLSVDVSELAEMENNEGLRSLGDLFVDIRLKNPRFVYPSLYLKNVDETARMLMNLDFSGFHLAVSLKIGQILSEGREVGRNDLWPELDCYLTDLIYAYEDMPENEETLMPLDQCVDIMRAMISSRVYISLGAKALQLAIAFNEAFIFSNNPLMSVDDPECIRLFHVASKESVSDDLGVQGMVRQWLDSFVQASLPSWMSDVGSDEDEFEKKADAFMGEAVTIYNLSKTVKSLVKNAIQDPRSQNFDNRIARWGFMNPEDPNNFADVEAEGLGAVEDALKGYFGYLTIFLVMGVGYNIGQVTPSQWQAVLVTFSRFREHCGI